MESKVKKEWKVYSPEGRNTSGDVKANLRTMSAAAPYIGTGEQYVLPNRKDDFGDDVYFMDVNSEGVAVVARENGQANHINGVFDELTAGIFLLVSLENFRAAESKLIKAFG